MSVSWYDLKELEKNRTYYFISKQEVIPVSFENVTRVGISTSGNHRLETKDGLKHIVPQGWVRITLEMDEWTF